MEKREGYKKTKIGWIPEGWDVSKLGTLVKISSGQSPSKFDFVSDGEYKFFKVNQLNFCSKYLLDSEFSYDSNGYDNFPKGMVVFPKRGASIFTNKVRILGEDGFFDTNVMGLEPNEMLSNEFLYYFLIMFELSNIADTSSVPQINNKHINPISIPLPPLPEQKKIASILTTVDDKISSIDYQIQQTEQLKKGLMEKLLTEGIGHTEFKETKIGRIPKGWDYKTIKELSTGTQNGLYKKKEFYGSGPEMVHMPDIFGNEKIIEGTMKKVQVSDTELEKYKLLNGDLLFARRSLVAEGSGKCCLVDEITENITFESSIIRVSLHQDRVFPLFIYYFMSSDIGRKEMMKYVRQVAVSGITGKDLQKYNLPLPPIEEQKQIATILSTVDDKIDILIQKKTQYQTLKKGLSQQLLTGQIRVKI